MEIEKLTELNKPLYYMSELKNQKCSSNKIFIEWPYTDSNVLRTSLDKINSLVKITQYDVINPMT